MNSHNKKQPSVVIIGAGMTGLLAVIKLRKAGIENVIALEKKDRLGGTWRENTYPGVACDIPAPMYTYDFEPNPDWSEFFASGAEIQQYFENTAQKYDALKYIQFNETVTQAHYDSGKWQVATASGKEFTADFVINATGILHHPAFPDIPGLQDFKGNLFHTAQWDHSVPIDESQRIGVIGTGSTAAQAIPELIKTGAKVTVFQRTAQWILPIANFRFPQWLKTCARQFGWCQYLLRKLPFLFMEHIFTKAVIGRPLQRHLISFFCKLNVKRSIKDDTLRKKLTPDYRVGCKRIIINKTFYRAIQQPNAVLETQGIERITQDGVLTKDGKLHVLDTLALSTGFDPVAFMRPMDLTGKDNLHINDAWQKQIRAYRSILLRGFPNFFLMLGPYTPIGNFSVIAMSEVQLDYIIKVIQQWQTGGFDSVEPKQSAVDAFFAHVKNGLKNTAWVSGCKSWYLDGNGDPILWPYTWQQWVNEMQQPNWQDLQCNQYSKPDDVNPKKNSNEAA